MEEKENRQDQEYEQRPSQKYGRTAYQKQQEQEKRERYSRTYYVNEGNPYQEQQYYGNGAYQQGNPYYSYSAAYTRPRGDVRGYQGGLLAFFVAVAAVTNAVITGMAVAVMSEGGYLSADYMKILSELQEMPGYAVISSLNSMAFMAVVAFCIVDIVKFYRAGYKITGLILFALFLRPAYFIWRAHLQRRKKAWAIVYAVALYLITAAQVVWVCCQAYIMAVQMVLSGQF